MGGASSYMAMLAIAGFLCAAWTASKISQKAGVSSIVLEISTGVVLGPSVLGLIAPEYAECQQQRHVKCEAPPDLHERILAGVPLGGDLGKIANMDYCPRDRYDLTGSDRHRRLAGDDVIQYNTYDECLVASCEAEVSNQCQLTPDFFTLVGHMGVAMMIFESGMHFDFDKARTAGPKACAVAVIGTVLPLIAGTALTVAFGKPMMEGVAVGTALAPTSVGIALRLLGEAGVLETDFGQAIITAAFVDDILSLVLFNVVFSLRGSFNVVPVVVYPMVGVAFMVIAMYLAVKFWPWVLQEKILPAIPAAAIPDAKLSSKDEVLFMAMMLILFGYATITHFLGTHLWGCFVAGMSFACLQPRHHAHHVWVKQTKRATGWMIRIFFACTVAFSIPIDKLISLEAFWKGSIMGIGPCVLSKVLCAPFMGPPRWVIGWAMVGRAEFAYLIAQMAFAAEMMDEATFSIVIWALLYATIFAPFIFRTTLNRYITSTQMDPTSPEKGSDEDLKDAHDIGGMVSSGI